MHHQKKKNLKDSSKISRKFQKQKRFGKEFVCACSERPDWVHLVQYANTESDEKWMLREKL